MKSWFVPALLVLASCSTQEAGTARPADPPATSAAAFNSCDVLSDTQVTALGLDPATKENADIADLATGCLCRGQDAVISILTGSQTVEALKARADFTGIKPLTLSGLDAVSFLLPGDPNSCAIGIAHGKGSVIVHASLRFDSIGKADPCPIATDVATTLAPQLPS